MQRVIVAPRLHFNELLMGARDRFLSRIGIMGVFVGEIREVTSVGVTIRMEHKNPPEDTILFDKTEEDGVYKFQGEEYVFLDIAVV